MKIYFCLLLIPVLLVLSSCKGTTSARMENTSPDGKVKVKVEANRSNVLDAFKTELSVNAYNHKEGKLVMEIMANDLNKENVKFNWNNDNTCTITIEERDGHFRYFKLIANENQLQLGEI